MSQLTLPGRRHHACLSLVMAGVLAAGWIPAVARGASLRQTPIVQAVQSARPSVVNITGRKTLPPEQVRSTDPPHQVNGMGTGVIIDPRGYAITNHHVVEGVSRIRVTMADGSNATATLVAHDPQTDLAIIKLPAESPLPVIRIGSSVDLMPGETVIAVGNAYGYEHTVTQGIISALHRSVEVSDHQKYHDLIQTDASINPGNSGGPLLNIDGDMIGINVAVRVGAQGIGFAIPVDQAMDVAAQLLSTARTGNIDHGLEVKTRYELAGSHAVVHRVLEDSPADKAGLQRTDIIVSINGQDVQRALDFERLLLERSVGEELQMTIDRQGQQQTVALVLTDGGRLRPQAGPDRAWKTLGMRLAAIPDGSFRQFQSRYRGGLKVVNVRGSGPAAAQGIRRGDILVGLHKWETVSLDNVVYILDSDEADGQQPLKFYILRNGETLYGYLRLAGS